MKQIGFKIIKGQIEVLTGLHIGGSNDIIEIGGMDNPVIKNPITNEPYIPGSSLKGKMRSLMEWKLGKVKDSNGEPCKCSECEICRVFGTSNSKDNSSNKGPTRIIVRDAFLSEESKKLIKEGKKILEEKYENTINRITAVANPRPVERVVPSVTFDFEIGYRIIDTGENGETDKENFENVVLTSMALLEKDYLGGGGTRGSGKIKFINLKDEEGKEITLQEVKEG